MKLETVGRIAVCDLGFKICWQIDDVDGGERAFLDADTAPYAKAFGNEGNLRVWGDLDAKLAGSHHRARLFALLPTFLSPVSQVLQQGILLASLTFGLHCNSGRIVSTKVLLTRWGLSGVNCVAPCHY